MSSFNLVFILSERGKMYLKKSSNDLSRFSATNTKDLVSWQAPLCSGLCRWERHRQSVCVWTGPSRLLVACGERHLEVPHANITGPWPAYLGQ